MNWRLAAGWLLALVVTTAVAWQIVAVADDRIGDKPLSPVEAAAPSTTERFPTIVTQGQAPTITEAPEPSTTTTAEATPTSMATTTTSSSPTTTPTTTETTAITSDDEWSTKTTVTNGGTVVVSYRPGEVVLETAVPLAGFQFEIDKEGPPAVEVEFESSSLRVDFRAEWEDDELRIEVEEDRDSGD